MVLFLFATGLISDMELCQERNFQTEIYSDRPQFESFSPSNKSCQTCLTRRWTKPLRGGEDLPLFKPCYNIASGKDVPVIVREGEGKRLKLMCWGLVPAWAKDPSIGNRMINARAETLAEKPSSSACPVRAVA